MGNGTPRVKNMKPRMVRSKVQDVEHMAARFYREINPRREQEIMDARLIQEDHNAFANLSPNFINKQWNPDRYVQSLGKYDEKSEVGE